MYYLFHMARIVLEIYYVINCLHLGLFFLCVQV